MINKILPEAFKNVGKEGNYKYKYYQSNDRINELEKRLESEQAFDNSKFDYISEQAQVKKLRH